MKPGKIKIFNALLHAEHLTFMQLKKVAKLSSPVLSEYLAKMQVEGVVIKDLQLRKYKLAKMYCPMETFPDKYQKGLKFFSAVVVQRALKISQMKNKEAREEAFRKFLDSTFHCFTVFIWRIIGGAISVFGDEMENLKDQDLIVEMNAIIHREFQDWVMPIANFLSIAMAVNLDILKVGDEFFNEVIKDAAIKFDSLIQDTRT